MASAYSHPVSGKIDNKINLFRQNIDENKAEVNKIREEMKQLIDKKSDELLRELEGVWEKVNGEEKKKKELDQNLRDVREHQKAMEDLFRKMNQSFTQMTEVSERIETVKKEIDTKIPVVKLNWKLNALKDSINDMCSCSILEVPNSPVTPKPTPSYDKLEGNELDKPSVDRVIAYFDIQGKDYAIHGIVLNRFVDKSNQLYYELRTDIPVPFLVRDKEIRLRAQRTTRLYNSLFVRTEQCDIENSIIQDEDPPSPQRLPSNHPTTHTGAVTTQRRARFILGDLITLPLDGTSGLINGTVGYCGIHREREVVELCANSNDYKSAFICGLKQKYEVSDFPDYLRHHDMKGFSLVVVAKSVIFHDGSLTPTDFSQPVSSSRMNPDPYHSGYPPQDRSYDDAMNNEIGSENQVAMIQNLIYQEPIQVVTEYGRFDGSFKCIIEFQGQLHVGVELEQVPPGPPSFWRTPDGVHHNDRLFDCRPGYGALVPINKCQKVSSYSQP